jgi:polygalacturonase
LETLVIPFIPEDNFFPFITSLLNYGGNGDGTSDNTEAFKAGVVAVAASGGGTLFVPAGRYLTSAFNLTSNMTLLLNEGATILSGTDYASWPLVPPLPSFNDGARYAPLIGGVGLTNVKILGNITSSAAELPTIDGQGLIWEAANSLKVLKGQRPHAIELNFCDDIEIANIVVSMSAFWSVHPVYSSRVYIHDMEVNSIVPNGDGIDPDSCDGVVIDRVKLTTGDDAIAIKSGTQGINFPPTNNVTIRNSVLSSSEACVAIGSEMTAGISNVVVGPNVTCTMGGHGLLYVKETQHGGGYVTNVLVHDVQLTGAFGKFLWLSQHFGENGENILGDEEEVNYPIMTNISLRNITANQDTVFAEAAVIAGDLPVPGTVNGTGSIVNVTLMNVNLGEFVLGGWMCANQSGIWKNVSPPPSNITCPGLMEDHR